MSMDELRETFFLECEELLESLADNLAEIDAGSGDEETVNAVFRAVHSIKGGAGAFGLDALVRFAHKFETTLDEVRAGRIELTPEFAKMSLRAYDVLYDVSRAARDDIEPPEEAVDRLIGEMEVFLPEPEEEEEDDFEFQVMSLDLGGDDDEDPAEDTPNRFRIGFRALPRLYERGSETISLFRALGELGILTVEPDLSSVPELGDLNPDESYLSWSLLIETEEEEDEVREIFEFVEEDCDLEIVPDTEESGADGDAEPAEGLEIGDGPDLELELAEEADSDIEASADLPASDVMDLAVEPAPAEVPEIGSAKPVEKPEKAEKAEKKEGPRATVRIDVERVERLINLVGELVINQAVLSQKVAEADLGSQNSEIGPSLDELRQLTRDIQESVMAIRAQPVKPLFQRMSRIVREASDATGKNVLLITDGENTEVDKTVIERLSDPLTHMIRNAVDHGLETPEKREAAGKDPQGTVKLIAAHRSGRVVIEIADDGAGINRERVLEKAVEKGLVAPDAKLSDSEIDNLLFMPGFSTAASISNLSGRGVGMDVVKRSIQSLGGRIAISSEPGKGSTFSISLPLTMAVLDGIVVHVGEETVVVPISNVVETLKPTHGDLHSLGCGSHVIHVRGEFVPVVDVGAELNFRPAVDDLTNRVMLLTESDDGVRAALVIDMIQDQRQVVIKGLQENYGDVAGIAAATILGDGRIALIVDVDVLVAASGGTSQTLPLAG